MIHVDIWTMIVSHGTITIIKVVNISIIPKCFLGTHLILPCSSSFCSLPHVQVKSYRVTHFKYGSLLGINYTLICSLLLYTSLHFLEFYISNYTVWFFCTLFNFFGLASSTQGNYFEIYSCCHVYQQFISFLFLRQHFIVWIYTTYLFIYRWTFGLFSVLGYYK